MTKIKEDYDIAVIGGGPSGIMAAIMASSVKTVLIDKNNSLGKKLLITGGGRCNITQANFNNYSFVEKLGPNGKFLLSALSVFNSKNVINFFEKNNLATKIERGNRVFPVSNKSTDVLKVLYRKLKNVDVLLNQKIINFNGHRIITKDREITAKAFIIATGGKTFPSTGSTGDGYNYAQKIGHTIIEPKPALSAIEINEEWINDLQGLSLKNVKISIKNKKKSLVGEILFTHFGISGPLILNLSKEINNLLNKNKVILEIDLKPGLTIDKLDKKLQKDFQGNIIFKNYLKQIIPLKMINHLIQQTGIDANKKVNSITKQERKKIILFLKKTQLTVKKLAGFNHAIVTSGGVNLKEINPLTMQSKIKPNVFFAGEVIDLDGPTGGYNLQIAWTTGYVAGKSALNYIS